MASYYLLLTVFVLPLLLLLKCKPTSSKNKYKLPLGPWTIPFIGSLHHLISASLPHHTFRKLSVWYGDLIFLQLGEHPTVLVSSSEAAREIFKTHDLTFSSRPVDTTVKIMTYGGKGIVFAPYGEYWRHVRKICVSELLSSKRVQSFESIRREEVKSFVQQIASLSSNPNGRTEIVNLSERLLAVTNNVLLMAIMGSKFKDQKVVWADLLKGIELGASLSLANLFPSSCIANRISGAVHNAERCHKTFDRFLDNLIREHKEKGADGEVEDLLAVLLRLLAEDSDNGLLTVDTVKSVILDLIIAGTDTTAGTLDWVMAELMRNPTVMKKAQTEVRQLFRDRENMAEMDLSKLNFTHLVIKETLRLHPAAPHNLRQCRETCQILGYDIPKGTNIVTNVWAIGRDTRYWEDAEEFKPERFSDSNADVHFNGTDFRLLPFGSGRRICPGISFAMATMELVLANLLYHFDWKLPCGMTPDQVDMTENFRLTSTRKYPLLVHAHPYQDVPN